MPAHHRTPFIFYYSHLAYSAYELVLGQWEENGKPRESIWGDDAKLCIESNLNSRLSPGLGSCEAGTLPTVAYYSTLCCKCIHIYFADCGTARMLTGKVLFSIYILPSLHHYVNYQTNMSMEKHVPHEKHVQTETHSEVPLYKAEDDISAH